MKFWLLVNSFGNGTMQFIVYSIGMIWFYESPEVLFMYI